MPESVELIISPGCCGRNTSDISKLEGYRDRFYYLEMDEADIVTGRHLKRIPQAIKRLLSDRQEHDLKAPKVVMLVTTCVDALLGTDMESLCKKCEDECGVKVRPAYMYALTRDGVHPPMVAVRESIFSLLEKKEKNKRALNFLGAFGGLTGSSETELASFFAAAGIRTMRQLCHCKTFDEFEEMAEANFNVILDPEVRDAAEQMQKDLGIGYVEIGQFYGLKRISSQYKALLKVFDIDSHINEIWHIWAEEVVKNWRKELKKLGGKICFSIGECVNALPTELALSMIEYGFDVAEIFCTLSKRDAFYIKQIAKHSPQTRIYFNQHPSMVGFEPDTKVKCAIGKDSAWYYRKSDAATIDWNSDTRAFGYHAVTDLLSGIALVYAHHFFGADEENTAVKEIKDIDQRTQMLLGMLGVSQAVPRVEAPKKFTPLVRKKVHGYRRVLTPFAPDQSGAVSALFNVPGALIVVLDAGGCTGNICGFDEPRWGEKRAFIFSAGMRDMDAVMGRDDELIKKILAAVDILSPSCIALIGTPVPATIGTDYMGLKRVLEKKCQLPVMAIETDGTGLYDKGEKLAYSEMQRELPDFSFKAFGLTPLDYSADEISYLLEKMPEQPMAFSVGGYAAAGKFVAPDDLIMPPELKKEAVDISDDKGPVLIVGEQIFSNALRNVIKAKRPRKKVRVAGFFEMLDELMREGDEHLDEEDDFAEFVEKEAPTLIIADAALKALVPEYGGRWIDRPHFALSGRK